jgi:hypothetical protein
VSCYYDFWLGGARLHFRAAFLARINGQTKSERNQRMKELRNLAKRPLQQWAVVVWAES